MFSKNSNSKSFTLVELLVVVAIIGILASIVLVNMKGIQRKGRITGSLQFSQTINHTLGAYAVGIWNLNDKLGNIASDRSDYGNHGTIINEDGDEWTDDTPHKVINREQGKFALEFNGVDNYVDCGNDTTWDIVNALTIEAWVKIYTIAPAWQFIAGKSSHWGSDDYGLHLKGSGLEFYADTCRDSAYFPVSTDRWYYLVGVYDGSNRKLYVNGNLEKDISCPGKTLRNNFKFTIGADNEGEHNFNGIIDEVRIYERVLSTVQIQKHYAEGKGTWQ